MVCIHLPSIKELLHAAKQNGYLEAGWGSCLFLYDPKVKCRFGVLANTEPLGDWSTCSLEVSYV